MGIVNVDGTLKGIAASVAGKCGCSTYLTDKIEALFPDEFKKQQFLDLVNNTYSLNVTINQLKNHNILQDFCQYVGGLLLYK